jgi:hypothetical protein
LIGFFAGVHDRPRNPKFKLELLNQAADDLNAKATDVLDFQAMNGGS